MYAIQAGEDGPIKIGLAAKPWERLATLQTANPVRLHGRAAWRGSPAEEKALHEMFATDRLEGEWFRPTPEIVGLVEWLGAPTCEFVRPADCLGHVYDGAMRGMCGGCGVEFDPEARP